MYFWIAIISMFSWVFHNLLFAKYARKYDWLTLSLYRSWSLLITMLPILFLADFTKIPAISDNIWVMLIWGLLWWISIVLYFEAQKYLPLWVAVSLNRLDVIVIIAISYFLDWEVLTASTYIWITTIMLWAFLLSTVKNHMPHLNKNTIIWYWLMIPRVITVWIWFYMVWKYSKEIDFWFSAYIMETFVFVWVLLSIIVARYLLNTKIKKVSFKDFRSIFLISFLTLWWTWWYALAVSSWWSMWVISSILATNVIFVSILSYFIPKETLNFKQWIYILLWFTWLIILKLSI